MRVVVGFALLVATSSAAADPLAIVVGTGIRAEEADPIFESEMDSSDEPDGSAFAPALVAQLGYRVSPALAVVAHGGFSQRDFTTRWAGTINSESHEYDLLAIDLAIGVELRRGRFWTSPWLGLQLERASIDHEFCAAPNGAPMTCSNRDETAWSDGPAVGLTSGVAIWRNLDAFVDAGAGARYGATVGLAYRR